jgi:hypothetical protein
MQEEINKLRNEKWGLSKELEFTKESFAVEKRRLDKYYQNEILMAVMRSKREATQDILSNVKEV